MYYDDLEGFGPNRHKTEQNAYPNSERAGAGRDDTGPPASETGQPHGKLHVTLPRVAKSPSCPFPSILDRERDDEEKNRGGKNQEKKISRSLPPFPCSIPREEFAPKSIDLLCPVHQSVDRSARVSGLPRGSDLVFASSGEEPEEEMNGAGGSHQQQQQRLRQQQQQQQALLMQQALQQQQQYQSGVLAAAAAAAMTQVVPPDPRFLICCFVCALGGITARRSAY